MNIYKFQLCTYTNAAFYIWKMQFCAYTKNAVVHVQMQKIYKYFDKLRIVENVGFAMQCSVKKSREFHRVDRVLIFFSGRPNWDSPTLSQSGKCVPPSLVVGGGAHWLEWLVTVPLSASLGT
jgi:hypothetical protein